MSRAETISALLAGHLGLDADSVGEDLLVKTVERRAAQRGLLPDAYVDRLVTDGRELGDLVEDVVVPETWFYRDGAPFELIARRASRARMDRPGIPYRVMSLPCST